MMKLLIINCYYLLFLCTDLWFAGCSLIGFAIGGAIDPEETTPLSTEESLRKLTKGSDVVIVKKNGEMVTGVFLTSRTVGDPLEVELYRTEYEKWRVQYG